MSDTDHDEHQYRRRTALYTMEEAAAKLMISRRTLQKLIKKAPYYRIAGKRKVFNDDDIWRLIEALPSPDKICSQT
jgi:excisionase family DNA binding protein